MIETKRVYRAGFILKHLGEPVDDELLIVASDFKTAYDYAQTRRNGLRLTAVHKELELRSLVPVEDHVEIADDPAVLELIKRIITGDGAQLENLDMSPDEWKNEEYDFTITRACARAGRDCTTQPRYEARSMRYKVTLFRKGRTVMITSYEVGVLMRNPDGTYSSVSADWLIKEWHDRLKWSIDIEVLE